MSPLPPDQQQHFFISKNNNNLMINNKMDSGRIDLLLGLALHTPAVLSSLSPATVASGVPQQQQPSLTLSLLFPSATQQQQNMSGNCDDISSYSNSFVSVKRQRREQQLAVNNTDLCEEEEDVSNTAGSGSSTCRRRKLRLNKKQSALLEDSFKLHTTLNPKQKEALAMQLNLRPRQVEVWFQNRRARTKLKQTEVDCEFLKKCCERLAEENEKLHKELQQLKSLNKRQQQQPLYMHQLPPTSSRLISTTSTTSYMMQYYCPSCHQHQQRQVPPNNNPSSSNFLISSKKGIIFNPFTKAAC